MENQSSFREVWNHIQDTQITFPTPLFKRDFCFNHDTTIQRNIIESLINPFDYFSLSSNGKYFHSNLLHPTILYQYQLRLTFLQQYNFYRFDGPARRIKLEMLTAPMRLTIFVLWIDNKFYRKQVHDTAYNDLIWHNITKQGNTVNFTRSGFIVYDGGLFAYTDPDIIDDYIREDSLISNKPNSPHVQLLYRMLHCPEDFGVSRDDCYKILLNTEYAHIIALFLDFIHYEIDFVAPIKIHVFHAQLLHCIRELLDINIIEYPNDLLGRVELIDNDEYLFGNYLLILTLYLSPATISQYLPYFILHETEYEFYGCEQDYIRILELIDMLGDPNLIPLPRTNNRNITLYTMKEFIKMSLEMEEDFEESSPVEYFASIPETQISLFIVALIALILENHESLFINLY